MRGHCVWLDKDLVEHDVEFEYYCTKYGDYRLEVWVEGKSLSHHIQIYQTARGMVAHFGQRLRIFREDSTIEDALRWLAKLLHYAYKEEDELKLLP